MIRVVTIDGPAGAGKSTISKQLAQRLGWRLLDTGAMFRAVTCAAIRAGVDLTDAERLDQVAATADLRFEGARIWLNGQEISQDIRSLDVTSRTKYAANHPGVRQRLRRWQRDFAEGHAPIVTEGRDQGTIVFPDAFLKIFLTASLEERAQRRHSEFAARGETISYNDVLNDMKQRDREDEARAIAPLTPAPDARLVDTTGLSFAQVLDRLEGLTHEALARLSYATDR